MTCRLIVLLMLERKIERGPKIQHDIFGYIYAKLLAISDIIFCDFATQIHEYVEFYIL